jgi:twitching motility protein PilI
MAGEIELRPPAPGTSQAETRAWLTPSDALARRPRLHVDIEPAAPEAPARYGFQARETGLLIEPGRSGEILDAPSVYPVPNTAPWLLGLINVRGNLVPAVDLAQLLDGHENPSTCDRFLVVGAGALATAFPIDELPRRLALGPALERHPPVSDAIAAHVREAYLVDGQPWLDVDFDAFLLALTTHGSA